MSKRFSTLAVAVAMLLMAFAPAALAVQYGPYTKNCGNQYVVVRSYAQYDVGHYYPSGTLQVLFDNSDGYRVRSTHTGSHSTSWKVTADDSIIVSGTYAYCVSYG